VQVPTAAVVVGSNADVVIVLSDAPVVVTGGTLVMAVVVAVLTHCAVHVDSSLQ